MNFLLWLRERRALSISIPEVGDDVTWGKNDGGVEVSKEFEMTLNQQLLTCPSSKSISRGNGGGLDGGF